MKARSARRSARRYTVLKGGDRKRWLIDALAVVDAPCELPLVAELVAMPKLTHGQAAR